MMIAKALKDNAPRRPIVPHFQPRRELSSLLSYWEIACFSIQRGVSFESGIP